MRTQRQGGSRHFRDFEQLICLEHKLHGGSGKDRDQQTPSRKVLNVLLVFAVGGFFFFFLAGVGVHEACEILVSQPEMEPVPPPVEMGSLNHWTAREFP